MDKKYKSFRIYKLQEEGEAGLAVLRLSLKANEAERPRPHPHPRSWLKTQPAPRPYVLAHTMRAPQPLPRGWPTRDPGQGARGGLPRYRIIDFPEPPVQSPVRSSAERALRDRLCPHSPCEAMTPAAAAAAGALATFSHYGHSDGAAQGTAPVRGRAPQGRAARALPAAQRVGEAVSSPPQGFLALEPAVPHLDWQTHISTFGIIAHCPGHLGLSGTSAWSAAAPR